MSIKTFAVFPDEKFKYGGYVYIGSPDISSKKIKEFLQTDSFTNHIKNEKLRKCFDRAEFYTVMDNSDKKNVCMAVYRFYPPFLWSKKKIKKALEESFDECRIG